MTISKIDFEHLNVDGIADVLQNVDNACKALDINFFIIGAVAKNVWFAKHKKSATGTRDIDFAVMVPSSGDYDNLKSRLIQHGYQQSAGNAYCIISPEGKQVDLLPFGSLELEGIVRVEGMGLTTIRVNAMREVYERGTFPARIGQNTYQVCTIPAVVLLKLVAFDDRPGRRIKDIRDVINHYADLEDDHIWENHTDLFGDEEMEFSDMAVTALGREIKQIIGDNDQLFERTVDILDKAIAGESALALHMIQDAEKETLENMTYLLELMKNGLTT